MSSDPSASREKRLGKQLADLFSGYDGPEFSIRLWNGWQWDYGSDGGVCTLVINAPDALASLAAGADEITLGEAFVRKELDVGGDLFSAFGIAEYLMGRPRGLRQKAFQSILANALSLRRWFKHGAKHSKARDLASISYHYNLPVAFYRPWLGEALGYSCAYFRSADDSLDSAQEQKFDLICRKLRLKRNERFLDVGCGWGSLVLHAACRYGTQAHGITLSREQADVANQRIRDAGLADSCTIEHRDYRHCEELRGSFDKIASIGMFEHVGLPNLPIYFATVHGLLKPGGTLLNHGIARSQSAPSPKHSFIDRYVFPDGRLVTITEAINAAEGAGFEVRDVENLREHYELTLRKWVEGLQKNQAVLLNLVPEATYRIWLLYTAGSAAAFQSGRIAIHQVLLSRLDRGRSRMPLVREDWYANRAKGNNKPTSAAHQPLVKPC
ncbi:putative fatty acid methyltransferase [Candidatus Sulfotelmatomonas gaucii]|uniref:Putative fatty acid methyltransferase n=1 Tax=Candidatus Sulfuritelmatomonas gaucii TaxID=2043161 RepID=A0A2N9LUC3_9BACT|nr:putative fatty acid methyltransferase [Candidatus Sulfotelmatomonas gaucii]